MCSMYFLWNEDEELTEFTNGNVVLEIIDGTFMDTSQSIVGLLSRHLSKEQVTPRRNDSRKGRLTMTDLRKSEENMVY